MCQYKSPSASMAPRVRRTTNVAAATTSGHESPLRCCNVDTAFDEVMSGEIMSGIDSKSGSPSSAGVAHALIHQRQVPLRRFEPCRGRADRLREVFPGVTVVLDAHERESHFVE